ncbi:GntR family transcriptional regulator [Streptomyces olivaceus]|uniref:GntR family transcriptional regulator n=1 Tax=Streptomyces olivaceus TaxID=47716 RepID=UPI00362A86C9
MIPGFRPSVLPLHEGILDGTFPASQPLPSEGALTKQFGVTRPGVRQDLSEVRASGPVEAIKGRGTFAHSPHTVAPATRARGVRRPSDGRDVKAEGTRWTDAEPPVAARTDTPLTLAELIRIPPGEPMSTYDALQTADHGHLRQPHRTYVPFSVLIDTKYEEETPPPAPELYTPLSDQSHELHFTEYIRTRRPLPDQAQALRPADGVPTEADKPLALEEFHLPDEELELSFRL